MNTASWDEAFLIFKKWRGDPNPALISVLRVFNQEHIEETVMGGGTAQVVEVDSASGRITVGLAGADSEEIDLSGAEFEYDDMRSTGLIDGQWECTLAARFPDGTLIVFAEVPSVE